MIIVILPFHSIELLASRSKKKKARTEMVQVDEQYRCTFNGSALPNGVYIYRLTTDAEVVIEKFMIAQ